MLEAIFHENGIEFRSYPFRPASVSEEPAVHFDLIKDVDLSKSPPEVRLKSGEILFISATQSKELEAFAARFRIAALNRVDVWADLLEPFLDTEFSLAEQEKTLRRLEEQGFSRREIASIRKTVKDPVLLYNSVLWEWVHLGLFDVLEAVSRQTSAGRFEEFYWYAMEIANRASAQKGETLPRMTAEQRNRAR